MKDKGCGRGYDKNGNLEEFGVVYAYKVCGRTFQDGIYFCKECIENNQHKMEVSKC